MEKRSEPRFAVEQDVYVRVLDGARAGMAARIVNRSANGLALALGCPVAAGTAIEVNSADAVLQGRGRVLPRGTERLDGRDTRRTRDFRVCRLAGDTAGRALY